MASPGASALDWLTTGRGDRRPAGRAARRDRAARPAPAARRPTRSSPSALALGRCDAVVAPGAAVRVQRRARGLRRDAVDRARRSSRARRARRARRSFARVRVRVRARRQRRAARRSGAPAARRGPRRAGPGRPRWEGDAHAGRVETSLMLALAPELVGAARERGQRRAARGAAAGLRAGGVRAVSPNGVLGDPPGASPRRAAAARRRDRRPRGVRRPTRSRERAGRRLRRRVTAAALDDLLAHAARPAARRGCRSAGEPAGRARHRRRARDRRGHRRAARRPTAGQRRRRRPRRRRPAAPLRAWAPTAELQALGRTSASSRSPPTSCDARGDGRGGRDRRAALGRAGRGRRRGRRDRGRRARVGARRSSRSAPCSTSTSAAC